jgi:hypothetical protein
MDRYEEELNQVLSAIQIDSPALLRFAGSPVPVTDNAQQHASQAPAQVAPIVTQLQNTLYQECYSRRFSTVPRTAAIALAADPDFINQLSHANATASRWDAGWQVRRMETTGQVWAEKAGVVRILQPGEYMNFNGLGTPLKKGDSISYYVPRESTAVQPGLYFAFGETVMGTDHVDVIRFYWNLESEGAVRLMQAVTRTLNRFHVPFQFKCSIYRQGFDRRDSAVLYVNKRFYGIVRELSCRWSGECALHLRDDVPLFTLPLDKGLAVAEDPGTGESFGMNRCRHIAEAVWNAYSSGIPQGQYLHEVKKHFRKHGLDLARPYLNPGSVDHYSAPLAWSRGA